MQHARPGYLSVGHHYPGHYFIASDKRKLLFEETWH